MVPAIDLARREAQACSQEFADRPPPLWPLPAVRAARGVWRLRGTPSRVAPCLTKRVEGCSATAGGFAGTRAELQQGEVARAWGSLFAGGRRTKGRQQVRGNGSESGQEGAGARGAGQGWRAGGAGPLLAAAGGAQLWERQQSWASPWAWL